MYFAKRIERDRARFKKIVRGTIRSGIRKYISHGELIGRKGKDLVSIPLPQLEIPRFRFGQAHKGVGQGDGDPGDPIALDPDGPGKKQAGSDPGEHILEVELTLEELAQILGEELSLPRIEPRGKKNIVTEKDKYKSIARNGPEALRHFKRTFRRALRRQVISGNVRSGGTASLAGERGQAVPVVEDPRRAGVQRRGHLHDGCFRLHGRRTEGNGAAGLFLDRHLAYFAVQRRGTPLHHSRRRRPRGGRGDLLPYPGERRDPNLLGLRALPEAHPRVFPSAGIQPLSLSLHRRGQFLRRR